MLKRLLITVVAIFISMSAHTSEAKIDKTEPYSMMKQVSEVTFKRLKDEQKQIQATPDYLKVIVEEELLPYVNEQYAALKLLGPHLQGAKREDVNEFVTAFRAYLITTYAQVLTQYTDQSVQFLPQQEIAEDRRITDIKVDILNSPEPNIRLEFKLRKERNGEWRAFDMVAEGISLLSSKQSEWNGKIRQDGILSVANELKELANKPITFESQK